MFVYVAGDGKGVTLNLTRFQQRVEDATPAMREVVRQVKSGRNTDMFRNGGPPSKRWKPLDPGYRAWKARHYPGAGTLVRTGRLRDSLTVAGQGVETAGPRSATIGTRVPYAKYHQRGTRSMPARPIVDQDRDVQRLVTKIMQRWVVEGDT